MWAAICDPTISICLVTIIFASPFELFYLFICGYDMLVGFIIFSGFFFFFFFVYSVKGLFCIEGRERISQMITNHSFL